MILGLLVLLHYQGLSTFWPVPAAEIHTVDGKRYLGEVVREETYRPEASVFDSLPEPARAGAKSLVDSNGGVSTRRLLRTANFDLTQTHHHWVSDFEIKEESRPEWALVIERASNDGPFNGVPTAFLIDGKVEATEPADVLAKYHEYEGAVLDRVRQREKIKKDEGGAVSRKKEAARLAVRQAELDHGADSPQHQSAAQAVRRDRQVGGGRDCPVEPRDQRSGQGERSLSDEARDGRRPREDVAPGSDRWAYPANQLSFKDKLGIYSSRWWEFVSADPRNVNTEGGVFPAIWGTVAMTLLMSLAVVPFGVMASLYLREYAKAGVIISAVRIAVNNLAGVPSIVFGVFGLGFFCYGIGYYYDHAFEQARLPSPTFGTGGIMWASLTLALLTLPVVIVATEEALAAVPGSMREGSYACGASKWQTIRRIVLPRALPGILTGTILAMARGAGEVAPLMLVGVMKWVPDLPVDKVPPFVHLERSFMHLGFHIFDMGFQSPDSESARPMVYTTTLLLIVLIATLNLAAMWLRSRSAQKIRRHSVLIVEY